MNMPIERFALSVTNNVAGVVNLHLFFFHRALESWKAAEALGPGLSIRPPSWRELTCAALVDAEVSLSILAGQHLDEGKRQNRTDPLEKMLESFGVAGEDKVFELIKHAQAVRHFGRTKHEVVREPDRDEMRAMLESGRLTSIRILEKKGEDASPWRTQFA